VCWIRRTGGPTPGQAPARHGTAHTDWGPPSNSATMECPSPIQCLLGRSTSPVICFVRGQRLFFCSGLELQLNALCPFSNGIVALCLCRARGSAITPATARGDPSQLCGLRLPNSDIKSNSNSTPAHHRRCAQGGCLADDMQPWGSTPSRCRHSMQQLSGSGRSWWCARKTKGESGGTCWRASR
jgi:hypothetical protein